MGRDEACFRCWFPDMLSGVRGKMAVDMVRSRSVIDGEVLDAAVALAVRTYEQ